MKTIKILNLVPGLDSGGIEHVLLNYYQKMDRQLIHFDFAIFKDNIGKDGKEFVKMGSKVFFLPPKSRGLKNYSRELYKILIQEQYDIVHAHQSYMAWIPLYIAKRAGVKVRIAHSHTTMTDFLTFKYKAYRILGLYGNRYFATHKMACGQEAGKYVFGKKYFNKGKVIVLPNAINLDDFDFNDSRRKRVRAEMGWERKFIIGNVGRLSEEKNQSFLLQLLKEIMLRNKRALLVMVGNGPLEKELLEKAIALGVEEHVEFLGQRNDVHNLLQAFDVFVLPSYREGLPVTGVEAITSGLDCIFSTGVPSELAFCSQVRHISLNEPRMWIDAILETEKRSLARKGNKELMKRYGFDIIVASKWLQEFYINAVAQASISPKGNSFRGQTL